MSLSLVLMCLISLSGFWSRRVHAQPGTEQFSGLNLAVDWPYWRGPARNGHANQALPVRFSGTEGVRWKSPIPGRGHSSPIVVGNRIFLTSADETRQTHQLLAYELETGQQIFAREVNQGGFPSENHPKNTEATPTVACDGQRLFTTFYHHSQVALTALDLNGQQVWQVKVADYNPQTYRYGYAPSPLVYQDLVIVALEYDGPSFLVAYRRETGEEVWRTPRKGTITFSSPILAHVSGQDQILISGGKTLAGYNPVNGKQLWAVEGTAAATCGTAVWNEQLVIASGGYPESETLAVFADGSGKVAWRNRTKSYEQSMIVVDGYVYALSDPGILFCWRIEDGQEMWRERLQGRISASPIFANGLIYWAVEKGTMYVFRHNPQKFELVSENRLGDEAFASPAVAGSRLILRIAEGSGAGRQEFLMCIGD